MVKIFTMVKDEADIVEDWVLYHGSLFGYTNLYIIDNCSTDQTSSILFRLKKQLHINVCILPDYTKKGEYMTASFRHFCRNEYGIPIDIDEFMVCYHKETNTISCNQNEFHSYLSNLPKHPVYKMNYINAKITKPDGYERAALEAEWGHYLDYNTAAKSFFHSDRFSGVIDHGNHYHTDHYYLTEICLVHYHARNLTQLTKKVYNNVIGLKYDPFNLAKLEDKIKSNNPQGKHHIQNQILILKKEFRLPQETHDPNDISLQPIRDFLRQVSEELVK
jgi:hypothetical protein